MSHTVAVTMSFTPQKLSIKTGDVVVWTVIEGTHTVTADDGCFDSGPLTQNQTFTYTFTAVNESFKYYCKFHGAPGGVGMSGVVEVVKC